MWFFHCHLDPHVPMGLGMVFQVESGTTPGTTLPTPPGDWVGVCDAQHYAAAAAAAVAAAPVPVPAPAPAPILAPAPAESPRPAGSPLQSPPAVNHKPSPSLPQRREHTGTSTSNSAAGPGRRATGHLACFLCSVLLFFVLHEHTA
jgi:laccase